MVVRLWQNILMERILIYLPIQGQQWKMSMSMLSIMAQTIHQVF